MFCNKCMIPMRHVLRFMNGKNYELYRCPDCNYESKPTAYSFNVKIRQKENANTNRRRRRKRT